VYAAAVQVRILKANLLALSRIPAHQEACRAVAIAPSDLKFATCSDDQSVKVWDLAKCELERTLIGALAELYVVVLL
jgi:polyadenylation factor subunit 2